MEFGTLCRPCDRNAIIYIYSSRVWLGMSYWFCALAGLLYIPLIWYMTDHPHQHKGVNKAELDYIRAGLVEECVNNEDSASIRGFFGKVKLLATNLNFILNMMTYWGSAIMWWGFMACFLPI